MKYISLKLAIKLQQNGCDLEPSGRYLPTNSTKNFSLEKCPPKFDLLWDVCIKHAKEFFGEGKCPESKNLIPDFLFQKRGQFQAYNIITLLMEGKKQEAEDYFWEHTLFNPKNKS